MCCIRHRYLWYGTFVCYINSTEYSWNYSPRARWAVRVPGLHFDGCAGMRHLAHVTYHQRHPLVVLQLTNGLVVRHVEKRLAINLQYLVPDHKAGTVCDTILVHAGDKDSQTVLDAAAYH